ncbi:hypothetical protein HK405_005121 [Cladochytrium tenue]|nr:hypothetical protein HK405_005121 [Cladochytrium tenue]
MDSGAVPADRLKHLRPQGIPTVVTWHGNSFDIARNAFNLAIATDTSPYDHPGDWPKAREDALAQDIVIAYKATYSYRHQFDHHVAINDRASADLHSIYRVPRSNIHTIFNPIDGTKFSPSNRNKPATDFRSAHHIPADAILIGFVGRLIPEKGIRFFLDAAQRLLGDTTFSSAASPRKIIFVVAGHGDLNDLARKAAEAHPGKIMNLGRVPRAQIPALVAALDLLVDPSVHYHGLNTVLLEATCSATDILAADIESVASVWRPTKASPLLKPELRIIIAAIVLFSG